MAIDAQTITDPQLRDLPRGGEYGWERIEDQGHPFRGYVRVQRVPIFAVGGGSNAEHPFAKFLKEVDIAWLSAAVEHHRAKAARENFLSPVHIGHHMDPDVRVTGAGFFAPTGTGTVTLDGEPRLAVMADLYLTASAFEGLRLGRLPYLSVEIAREDFPVERARFASVALLEHQPPQYEFPLLTVRGEQSRMAAARSDLGVTVAIPWREMMAATDILKAQADEKPEKSDDGEKKDGGDTAKMESAPPNLDEVIAWLKDTKKKIAEIEAALIGEQEKAEEPAADTAEGIPAEIPMSARAGDETLLRAHQHTVAQLRRQDEQLKAMRAELDAARAAKEQRSLYDEMAGQLEAHGIDRAVYASDLTAAVALGRAPAELVVRAFARAAHSSGDLPPGWDATGLPPVEAEAPAVARFAANPALYAKARQIAAEHARLTKSGHTVAPIENWLAGNGLDMRS